MRRKLNAAAASCTLVCLAHSKNCESASKMGTMHVMIQARNCRLSGVQDRQEPSSSDEGSVSCS